MIVQYIHHYLRFTPSIIIIDFFMFAVFEYEFMLRAFLMGAAVSVIAPIMGNFLVTSRRAVFSDMLSHVALVGVGLGLFLQQSPYTWIIVISVISAVLFWFLSWKYRHFSDALAMMFLSTGLAIALILTRINPQPSLSLESFLFGSILTISWNEFFFIFALYIILITVIIVFWQRFVSIVADIEYMMIHIQYTWFWELFLLVLLSFGIAISLRTIGALLIGGVMIIPVLSAELMSRSFLHQVFLSILFCFLGVFSGLFFSFYWDTPPSAAIILMLVTEFLVLRVLFLFFSK